MIRIQISLSSQDYLLAKKTAKAQGMSLAELLGRALKMIMPYKQEKPWMQYAGMLQSDNPASSTQIDNIVYGHKD